MATRPHLPEQDIAEEQIPKSRGGDFFGVFFGSDPD
jgi:hypothetical protein